MIYNPVQLPAVVDIAIRTAYARRGVAHITVPNDPGGGRGCRPVAARRPGGRAEDLGGLPVPAGPNVDYAAIATANGAYGVKVRQPNDLPGAIRQALSFDGPALVDVNPDEPPMPGKVEYEQAKKFAEAFLKGQPHRSTIATTLFRDKIQQLRS
jgi:thiamine pyrophosphate-dependent acetolactate synthase large subunit-like protein